MLSAKVVSVMPDTAEASSLIQVNYETADGPGSVVAERLLMSVGRRPVMKGFGLRIWAWKERSAEMSLSTDRCRLQFPEYMLAAT